MVTIILCLMIAGYLLRSSDAQNLLMMLSAILFVLYPLATLV